MIDAAYLRSVVKDFRLYKSLGERAMAQVPTDVDVEALLGAESNSIAMVVQHISGNLRSRYSDFLTSDGEFERRRPMTRESVLRLWDEGWGVALKTLDALTPLDLSKTITIRGEAFLVVEALNRSVTHTAYHVGQIVYLARHLAGDRWTSLSIPKGKSAEFNARMKT